MKARRVGGEIILVRTICIFTICKVCLGKHLTIIGGHPTHILFSQFLFGFVSFSRFTYIYESMSLAFVHVHKNPAVPLFEIKVDLLGVLIIMYILLRIP